ncbi:tRNA 5-methoxyuridine(34)/uridine 5-oxyacetic acid(34) synthase CmoB [bacterium]|nr:tRNA 5-methoxyuridine(34)/uridine 5-oxyacetic acid(34) synthase CmoB [bacterium]
MDLVAIAQSVFAEKTEAAVAQIIRAGWGGDVPTLHAILAQRGQRFINPNVQRFVKSYLEMPQRIASEVVVDHPVVTFKSSLSATEKLALKTALEGLIPWRKGPYEVGGVMIDSEWRSDLKWDRIKSNPQWFHNRRVLDIGCNSGYYMMRAMAYSPRLVVGIDPSDLFFFQFHSLLNWMPNAPLAYLPIGLEHLHGFDHWFDTVLCMGILYHQRSPMEALRHIRTLLRPKGTVLLETLIIDGEGDYAITPKKTYAKMANVYYLPTLECLKTWIHRAGYKRIDVLDVGVTTPNEQRKTNWVNTESLADFLQPGNSALTVEGYPAPCRAVVACS